MKVSRRRKRKKVTILNKNGILNAQYNKKRAFDL